MISLTNYDFQWARSELVIIYPELWSSPALGPAQRLSGSRSWYSPPTSLPWLDPSGESIGDAAGFDVPSVSPKQLKKLEMFVQLVEKTKIWLKQNWDLRLMVIYIEKAATPCVDIMCIDSVEGEPVNIRNFIKTQGSKYCQSNFLYRCILGLRYPALRRWCSNGLAAMTMTYAPFPTKICGHAGVWASLLIPRCLKKRGPQLEGSTEAHGGSWQSTFRDGPLEHKAPHSLVTSQWDCCKSIRSNHIVSFIPLYVCYLYVCYLYVCYIYIYIYLCVCACGWSRHTLLVG